MRIHQCRGGYFQHFHSGINLILVLVNWNTPSPHFPGAEHLSGELLVFMPGFTGVILQENKSQSLMQTGWVFVWLVGSQESPVTGSEASTLRADTSTPRSAISSLWREKVVCLIEIAVVIYMCRQKRDTWCAVELWQCCCDHLWRWICLSWPCWDQLSHPPCSGAASPQLSLSILSPSLSSEPPCTGSITEYWGFFPSSLISLQCQACYWYGFVLHISSGPFPSRFQGGNQPRAPFHASPGQSWAGSFRAQRSPGSDTPNSWILSSLEPGDTVRMHWSHGWKSADFSMAKARRSSSAPALLPPAQAEQEDGGQEGQMCAFLCSQHSYKILSAFICLLIARCFCFRALSSASLFYLCWKLSTALPLSLE